MRVMPLPSLLFSVYYCILAIVFYYRATRMHSADYAVARCLSVRPSVCHTLVLCLNDHTYPQKIFTTE